MEHSKWLPRKKVLRKSLKIPFNFSFTLLRMVIWNRRNSEIITRIQRSEFSDCSLFHVVSWLGCLLFIQAAQVWLPVYELHFFFQGISDMLYFIYSPFKRLLGGWIDSVHIRMIKNSPINEIVFALQHFLTSFWLFVVCFLSRCCFFVNILFFFIFFPFNFKHICLICFPVLFASFAFLHTYFAWAAVTSALPHCVSECSFMV